MKRVALLLALAFAIGLYAWVNVQRGGAPATAAGGTAGDDNSGYTANNVELIETGADGLPRFRLQAAAVTA